MLRFCVCIWKSSPLSCCHKVYRPKRYSGNYSAGSYRYYHFLKHIRLISLSETLRVAVSISMIRIARITPIPTLCRADLGWIVYFGPANFRKIAGEFWWRILIASFSALFFQGFRPPQKITPKIHVQNCRHSSPISLSWTQNLFTAIFCLRGRPRITPIIYPPSAVCVSRKISVQCKLPWPFPREIIIEFNS